MIVKTLVCNHCKLVALALGIQRKGDKVIGKMLKEYQHCKCPSSNERKMQLIPYLISEYEREVQAVPNWTRKGGYFRLGDTPSKWERIDGKWTKDYLVPFGKANEKYKSAFWVCPECNNQLAPSETEYVFECNDCNLAFSWAWGKLRQQVQLDSYYIDDF